MESRSIPYRLKLRSSSIGWQKLISIRLRTKQYVQTEVYSLQMVTALNIIVKVKIFRIICGFHLFVLLLAQSSVFFAFWLAPYSDMLVIFFKKVHFNHNTFCLWLLKIFIHFIFVQKLAPPPTLWWTQFLFIEFLVFLQGDFLTDIAKKLSFNKNVFGYLDRVPLCLIRKQFNSKISLYLNLN